MADLRIVATNRRDPVAQDARRDAAMLTKRRRTWHCNAIPAELETRIDNADSLDTVEEKTAVIRDYAAAIAHNETPRHRDADDVTVMQVLRKLDTIGPQECIRFDAGIFNDWRDAINRIRRHPWVKRDRARVQVLLDTGEIEIGRRLTRAADYRYEQTFGETRPNGRALA